MMAAMPWKRPPQPKAGGVAYGASWADMEAMDGGFANGVGWIIFKRMREGYEGSNPVFKP